MRPLCRLYVRICRKWGPRGLTFSAAAHLRAKRGSPFWRNRIDGFCLLFFSDHQHCQASFQKGRKRPTPPRAVNE
jgi:hypothetical protein